LEVFTIASQNKLVGKGIENILVKINLFLVIFTREYTQCTAGFTICFVVVVGVLLLLLLLLKMKLGNISADS
jgi:hypothetical protein